MTLETCFPCRVIPLLTPVVLSKMIQRRHVYGGTSECVGGKGDEHMFMTKNGLQKSHFVCLVVIAFGPVHHQISVIALGPVHHEINGFRKKVRPRDAHTPQRTPMYPSAQVPLLELGQAAAPIGHA